ncbi:MAG: CvpA family protein [Cyclobacteriaceae bacterium]|nr:CvpA family protein [Cyclobacteriaceae bacterium]
MSKADLLLLVIIAIGAVNGYKEGFLMELLSLVAIVLGVLGGFKLMGQGMLFLQERFHADKARCRIFLSSSSLSSLSSSCIGWEGLLKIPLTNHFSAR